MLGAAIAFSEHQDAADILSHGIAREEVGGNEKKQTLYYRVDNGKEQSLTVDVAPRVLSRKEAMKLLEKAKKDWNRSWLKDNKSADHVSTDLNLPASMEDGKVLVDYESDHYEALDDTGTVLSDQIPKAGLLVCLKATFRYEEYRMTVSRYLHLERPEYSDDAKVRNQVADQLMNEESTHRSQARIMLPTRIGSHTISWRMPSEHQGLLVMILGIAGVAAMQLKGGEKEKKEEKRRQEKLLLEYPQMMEQLSLLLGSGMTVYGAWEKMIGTDLQMRKIRNLPQKEYISEMEITYREMQKGQGEKECYERFGRRIGLEPYRRLASVLSQNLSKGTRDIRRILEGEAQEALEMRQHTARRLGEEASTKMLGPMLLMFLIILSVILFPAIRNF